MRKIDKGYAVIYIDDESSMLEERKEIDNFTSSDMVAEYYTVPGAIQWNYYLIIPKNDLTDEKIKEIELNDVYTRKYVIDKDKIDDFIEETFPDVIDINKNKIFLSTANSWEEAKDKLVNEDLSYRANVYGSLHRDYNSMDTLKMLDNIRSELIKNKHDIYFYTHIENEISWVGKKFKFFGDSFMKI